MDPMSALGLAANVIQLVQFAGVLFSNSHEIYKASSGALGWHSALKQAADNLHVLSSEIRRSRMEISTLEKTRKRKVSPAEKQLQNLCDECESVSKELLSKLDQLNVKGRQTKWNSFRQALNSMWSQSELQGLEKRLDQIRAELNMNILVCMQETLRVPAPTVSLNKAAMSWFKREMEQLHMDILATIQENGPIVNNQESLGYISTKLDQSAELIQEEKFCTLVLSQLRFLEMNDRHEVIPEAHAKTFQWVFQDNPSQTQQWDSFTAWLGDSAGSNLYWLTGKPGSGKSTLMKFLYNDRRTVQHLQRWAGDQPLVKAGVFFWNSGTTMQMSQKGLVRSLLYQILQQHPQFITKVFRERWTTYHPLGGGPYAWTPPELRNALTHLIQELSKTTKIVLFIDGLDEYDGDHEELVQLIISVAKLENVKVCCASRPWLVFEDAFEHQPHLLMESLTKHDIRNYVQDNFEKNPHYTKLHGENRAQTDQIINEVVTKANGVFLWVYLVVKLLLAGLRDSDRICDLQRRLDSLPSDLEELFDKLLSRVDPFHFQHACQLIKIVRLDAPIPLLTLSFADESPAAAVAAAMGKLPGAIIAQRKEAMRRRLSSRCMGLIEVSSSTGNARFLHRTVKDFIDTPQMWEKVLAATEDLVPPEIALMTAYLFHIKQVEFREIDWFVGWKDDFEKLMGWAVRCEDKTGEETFVALLDDVPRVIEKVSSGDSMFNLGDLLPNSTFPHATPKSAFFNYAIQNELSSYVGAKVNSDISFLSDKERAQLLVSACTSKGEGAIGIVQALLKNGTDTKFIDYGWYRTMHPEARLMVKPQLKRRVVFRIWLKELASRP